MSGLSRESIKGEIRSCVSEYFKNNEAAAVAATQKVVLKALDLCAQSYGDDYMSAPRMSIANAKHSMEHINVDNMYDLYHEVKTGPYSYLSGVDECKLALNVIYNKITGDNKHIGYCLGLEKYHLSSYYENAIFNDSESEVNAGIESTFVYDTLA